MKACRLGLRQTDSSLPLHCHNPPASVGSGPGTCLLCTWFRLAQVRCISCTAGPALTTDPLPELGPALPGQDWTRPQPGPNGMRLGHCPSASWTCPLQPTQPAPHRRLAGSTLLNVQTMLGSWEESRLDFHWYEGRTPPALQL